MNDEKLKAVPVFYAEGPPGGESAIADATADIPVDKALVAPVIPAPPERAEPAGWEHYDLWLRVKDAIRALPGYFRSTTVIEGLSAADICTLNSPLGATIEDQVVQTLNGMRAVWDPDKAYQTYLFVRQSQTFPDVLLRRQENGQSILLGIELKGWYLLAKEKEPSFRFCATRAACAVQDLIVVVPWVLSNVLSGTPMVYPPFIESALYAAERRNYYWRYQRGAKEVGVIIEPEGVHPYPSTKTKISDRAEPDAGGNFGRLARYGIMDDYLARTQETAVLGVDASDWQTFFRKHARDTPRN